MKHAFQTHAWTVKTTPESVENAALRASVFYAAPSPGNPKSVTVLLDSFVRKNCCKALPALAKLRGPGQRVREQIERLHGLRHLAVVCLDTGPKFGNLWSAGRVEIAGSQE